MPVNVSIRLSGDRNVAGQYLRAARKVLADVQSRAVALAGREHANLARTVYLDGGKVWVKAVVQPGGFYQLFVHAPVESAEGAGQEQQAHYQCWCSRCFAEGVVREKLGEYSTVGSYSDTLPYPYACKGVRVAAGGARVPALWYYAGIRYVVEVCQRDRTRFFVCISSDFTEYAVPSKVVVLYMGRWSGVVLERSDCLQCTEDSACQGNYPDGRPETLTWNKADGTFVVMPFVVNGINDRGWTWERV